MNTIAHQTGNVLQPSDKKRITLIDSLRGFALFGLFLIHCIEYFELYWMNPQPSWVHDVIFFVFAGKAYAIFAMLFGVSFYIIMRNQKDRDKDFSLVFIWRLVILFCIGCLHNLIYSGDILQILSVLGLVLLVANRLSNTWVFLLSIIFLSNFPLIIHFYAAIHNQPGANDLPVHWGLSENAFKVWTNGSFWEVLKFNSWEGARSKWYFYLESGRVFQLFGLFMWGLLIGRKSLFSKTSEIRNKLITILVLATIVGIGIFFLQQYFNQLPEDFFQKEGMAKYYLNTLFEGYLSMAIMLVLICLFVLAYETSLGGKILSLLIPAGRMSLTMYVSQAFVCVPIYYGYGLGWYRSAGQLNSLIFGFVFFTCQILFAHWWMKRFYYGPLEWLWRALTYFTVNVPFQKKNTEK